MQRRSITGMAMLTMLAVATSFLAQEQAPTQAAGIFAEQTLANSEDEARILTVIEELQPVRGQFWNVPAEDGRLLRLLTESIGAQDVVEIGTSNGYSGLWFCLALRVTDGKLTTFEIDAGRIAIARDNFARAGVDQLVTIVEGDAHQRVLELSDPIDLLFIAADKDGYLDYIQKLKPLVRPGGLIVAHNMTARMADPRFVKAITTDPELETLFLHMDGAGVAVSLKKR